jgi:RNA polymerase sigma-70 factor (ECF subfamily)
MYMEDQAVITKVRADDTQEYGLLLDRYQPGLVYHCYAMVRDADIAQDMAQEACIKAYLQLARYRPEYRFSTWLYKIATNLCLDYLKKRCHVSLEDVPELPSSDPTPDGKLIREEAAREVQVAVAHLPLKYQTAISLYYWRGQTYEEIAEIMGVPLNTVRTWLRRANMARSNTQVPWILDFSHHPTTTMSYTEEHEAKPNKSPTLISPIKVGCGIMQVVQVLRRVT